MGNFQVLAGIILFLGAVMAKAINEEQGNFYVEAFQQEGEPDTLVLKLRPVDVSSSSFEILKRRGRQEEDEDEDLPSSTPFIPQVIPGLTKIFNGILTGNLNEIFHGSTSFAPKNVSYAIDTVYNQVVGIPPPNTAIPTQAPQNATVVGLNVNGTGIVANGTAAVATPVPQIVTVPTTTEVFVDEDEEVTEGEGEAEATGDLKF